MKILTVVGARPQFIKAAAVSHKLRKVHNEILVHTGQHYDYSMSEQFFEELDIPRPEYNLGISGGSHAQMTGKMLIAIEEILQKEKPDMVLLYGDTNSTLAGALAAAKLHIPICHVEAGARTHCMTNPEEINRICTDHVSSILLASTESGLEELEKEGLSDKAVFVGDPMYDAFVEYSTYKNPADVSITPLFGEEKISIPERFYYLTCHREENSNDKALTEILSAMEQLEGHTIYPAHPRNKERAKQIVDKKGFKNIILTEPVGYLDSIALMRACEGVVTDSGGLQREAFFAGKKCVTVLDFVVWPETMVGNRNQLAKPDVMDIVNKMNNSMEINDDYQPFGDGHAAQKIVEAIDSWNTGET